MNRGDPGINPLDAACKEHDIAYTNKDSNARYLADGKLQNFAMKRIFAKDASFGERATALAVTAAMKAKKSLTKLGKGMKKKLSCGKKNKKTVSLYTLIKQAKAAIKKSKPDNIRGAVEIAIKSVKKSKKGKRVKEPRIIKLPETTVSGGVLPLVPIFAGLSALGSIVGSTTAVLKAMANYKEGEKQMEENKRHNRTMESIAIGKGYYLRPFKTGKGYYLKPNPKNR